MKANCFPVLTDEVIDVLSEFYVTVRQEASKSYDGKPITARDLKSLERLTIARAKCEGRGYTELSDAQEAIRIYTESLESLGLTVTTAGELQSIMSDEEFEIINDIELMIKSEADYEGFPLSNESLSKLEFECGLKCHGTSLDSERVFRKCLLKVKNSL